MSRYKLTIEYDGTCLIGWQENAQGDSVQSVLQDAIYRFCQQKVIVVGAGRTDAGVHAVGMVAHVDIIGDFSCDTIMRAINFYLKDKPVSVLNCVLVPDDFHARFSCIARHYKYIVINRSAPIVLAKNRAWWIPQKLDIALIQSEMTKLVGKHDFTSFRAADCQANSPIKTLASCSLQQEVERLVFYFSAKSFLYHQVRNMVGTLIDIGRHKLSDIEYILQLKNRDCAGVTAPACGLYFIGADYDAKDENQA